jgi:hypothetical protein
MSQSSDRRDNRSFCEESFIATTSLTIINMDPHSLHLPALHAKLNNFANTGKNYYIKNSNYGSSKTQDVAW